MGGIPFTRGKTALRRRGRPAGSRSRAAEKRPGVTEGDAPTGADARPGELPAAGPADRAGSGNSAGRAVVESGNACGAASNPAMTLTGAISFVLDAESGRPGGGRC